jgi:UDP-N-acetylmuramate dehydrogenase
LVSDDGYRGVVLLNRAKGVRFEDSDHPNVWAESGVNFGALARLAAKKRLSGLEWAAGIPGTVGGAIVGNAGAHGSDISGTLKQVDIYHFELGRVTWPVKYLEYKYRDSKLKHMSGKAIVLSGEFQLLQGKPELINEVMERYLAHRRRTQPPGASIGSMFKNPLGDYAGRLIDAAGLKGTRVGDVEISPLHANFFINHGKATAKDVYQLTQMAHARVFEQFCVDLELEIELVGEW